MKNKKFILAILVLFFSICLLLIANCSTNVNQNTTANNAANTNNENESDETESTTVYKTPESFIVDESTGFYYVSNVNGSPSGKDDNGFIIKLDKNLEITDKLFISGEANEYELNAPKGMGIYEKVLYVTDIDTVRAFSTETGELIKEISIENASFLNDLTIGDAGNIYVSDTNKGIIHKIDKELNISKVADISSPNGLRYHKDGFLYVVTWTGAKIFKLSLDGKIEELNIGGELSNLDGIDIDDNGDIYFSDFTKGVIYKYNFTNKELVTVIEDLQTPADISLDKKNQLILIPLFSGDDILVHSIKD